MGTIGFSLLARHADLVVGRFDCCGDDATRDESAAATELVFVHRGAYRLESSRGAVLADRGQVLLLRRGEEYRVRHPFTGGDQSLVITLRRGLIERICRELGATREPARLERRLASPASHALYWRSRRLRAALERTTRSPAGLEEEAGSLAVDAVARFALDSAASRSTARRLDPRVEAVQRLLHRDEGRRPSLAELAAWVDLSPFVLAHRFRRQTGESVHQYRLSLVLREAVERLLDGERDLTALALELGFSDHAHFTNAFRRRFGLPPSAARDALAGRREAPPR